MTIDISVPENLPEPKWGALGEDVFRRTYSRTKADGSQETWAETCKRVVVGNCSFVGKNFIERGEPEKLFDLLYNFKVLPGGRHLWATGVKGASHVANCWSTGWTEDFAEHFEFAFARLMEGGGVGSNYSDPFLKHYEPIPHEIKLHIVCDQNHADYESLKDMISHEYSSAWGGAYQVQDSREGWVSALGMLLRSFYKYPEGFEFPEGDLVMDVSHVRPAGSPLKRFGGTASGPAPLVEMLLRVCLLMNVHQGQKPDSFLALDIDHEIARCVVAGNVRRSARMSMKHWKDEEIEKFITIKEGGDAHWTTNISVVLDRHFWTSLRRKDPHATKIMRMIAEGSLKNGEPGIFNITKANEREPNKIVTTNPCFVGNTLVSVADGRGAVPFRKLSEEGKDVPVFCRNKKGQVVVRWMRNPRKTGKKKRVLKITFNDGLCLRVTPDHKFVLSDGTETTARELQKGDSIPSMTKFLAKLDEAIPTCTKTKGQDYWWVTSGDGENKSEHRLIAEHFYGKIKPRHVVHHRNYDGKDNRPDNLEVLSKEDHDNIHIVHMVGDNNPMRRWYPNASLEERERYHRRMSAATSGTNNPRFMGCGNEEIKKIAKNFVLSLGRAYTQSEWLEFAEEASLPKQFSNNFRRSLGSPVQLGRKIAKNLGLPVPGSDYSKRFPENVQRYKDALRSGYVSVRHEGDWYPIVSRRCEDCGRVYEVSWDYRESSYCSSCRCRRASMLARVPSRRACNAVSKNSARCQVEAFNDLEVSLGRRPQKKEWENYCRIKGIPVRLHKNGNKTYREVEEKAALVNHRVVSVVEDGEEDVYNGTVDEFHNLYVGHHKTASRFGKESYSYVNTPQCGEITLPEFGACNLGSVNLRNFAYDRSGAFEAFRLMSRFLLRATYADYLDPRAQKVIERDRRIGVGFTGFADWLALEGIPFSRFSTSEKHKEFLRQARKVVRKEAHDYAFQLRIPEPVKVTTCAPTGSTSKLCGSSEGMQPVLFRYFKRRVNYSTRDPIQQQLLEKSERDGLEIEDSVYTPETKVVSYPCCASILNEPGVDESVVEEASDISLEEYLDAQKTIQDTFVDNSISFTVNVDPDVVTVEDLEKALASFGSHLKGTTIMPFVSNRPQMPYEKITKEEYESASKKFSSAGEWECKNNSCQLVLKVEEDVEQLV